MQSALKTSILSKANLNPDQKKSLVEKVMKAKMVSAKDFADDPLEYLAHCGDGSFPNLANAEHDNLIVCPGMFLTGDNTLKFEDNFLFGLAHELGHQIDYSQAPEIRPAYRKWLFDLKKIKSSGSAMPAVSEKDSYDINLLKTKLSEEGLKDVETIDLYGPEITADFWSAEWLASEIGKSSTFQEKEDYLFRTASFYCGPESTADGFHPTSSFRLDLILADAKVREALECPPGGTTTFSKSPLEL